MIPLPRLAWRDGHWHPVLGRIDITPPAMSMVIGAESEDQRRAYSPEVVRDRRVINDTAGVEPIVVTYDPDRDAAGMFLRQAGHQVLNFRAGGDAAVAVDQETQSEWDVTGAERPMGDATQCRSLQPLPHSGKLFWFSWLLFKPDTDLRMS